MEQYIYTSKHLDALKKYGFMKILFLLLGCLVMLLQSIAWIIVWLKNIHISTTNMVFVTITLTFSFFFVASQLFFGIRNKRIIKTIKQEGSVTIARMKSKILKTSTLSSGIVLFARIIAILFVILLGILTVSFIQNYLEWGKIILKMPLLMFMAVGFLNWSAELRFQTMVEKV